MNNSAKPPIIHRRFAVASSGLFCIALLSSSLLAGPALAIDPTALDNKTSPRVDFVRYAYGAWADQARIPNDRPEVGSFSEVDDPLQARLIELLKAPPSTPDAGKASELFRQGLDMSARNDAGISPVASELRSIRSAKSLRSLSKLIKDPAALFGPFSLTTNPSLTDPTQTSLLLFSGDLGLGARELYLGDDPQLKQLQQAYISYLSSLLQLGGYQPKDAKRQAQNVFSFEKKIALLKVDQQELFADLSVLKSIRLGDVEKIAPLVNWSALFEGTSITSQTDVIAVDANYLKQANRLFSATTLTTVKAYYTAQLLNSAGPYLDERFASLRFNFYGRTLQGIDQPSLLDEVVAGQTSDALQDAVGRLYVEKYFPPEAKAEITRMTQDIIGAFRARIEGNQWMTADTKKLALEKLGKVKVRVGYPDRWVSYDDVALGTGFFDTARNARRANNRRAFSEVGKPVDNTNWGPVTVVNAFYNPSNNSINFPAGILSGSFFDLKNDLASNYGSIGSVIGHELTHGFDPAGSQFDGDGRLTSWWTTADLAQFGSLNMRVAQQYSKLSTTAGQVDGEKTLGENVADMGGTQVAFDALQARMLTSPPVGLVNGLTPNQTFFVAYAQLWKTVARPEYAQQLLAVDVHAPGPIRAIQPLKNMASFYETFGIVDGDPMWLPVADRVVVW